MNELTEYKELLSKSYCEAVKLLLEKYEPAKYDYFKKTSYNNFLKGISTRINRGDYTRTSEGLYCHHIDEIEYSNLTDPKTIKKNNYSFCLQKKERLVYCDLVEHAILHVLIAKETVFKYGFKGYKNIILRDIEKWYIREIKPEVNEDNDKDKWKIDCYNKVDLKPEEASFIICLMFKELAEEFFKHSKEEIDEYEYVKNSIAKGCLFRK